MQRMATNQATVHLRLPGDYEQQLPYDRSQSSATLPAGGALEQALWIYKQKLHGPLGIALCVCGLALNLISCSIWRKKNVLVTGNVPLVAISVCYMVICFAYLPLLVTMYCVTPYATPKEQRNSYTNMLVALVSNQLQLIAHAVIVWLGVLMGFQRVVCISSRVPLHRNRLVSHKVTRLSIWLVTLLVIATSAPFSLVSELTPRKCFNNQSTVQSTVCRNTTGIDDGNSSRLAGDSQCRTALTVCAYYTVRFRPSLRALVHWTHIVLYKILPCVFMVLLSGVLFHSLDRLVDRHNHLFGSRDQLELRSVDDTRDSRKTCDQASCSSNRFSQVSQRVTRILIVIVASMVITQLPPAIVLISSPEQYKRLGELFDVFSLLDIAASFILYCKMSATFRKEFIRQLDHCSKFLCSCARIKKHNTCDDSNRNHSSEVT